ncbi:ATP-grasp domain-containing protein [Novosphingobium sp.]|uniref:ATP-grasp domain-containing protein n=1 Tax=Novosphingobium sp. TaxID=1874826 RepID=UPI003BAA252F
MNIAFLACSTTLPGAPDRRADAFEHDQQMAALVAALAPGEAVTDIDWQAPLEAFAAFDAALIGTPWDYQDNREAFLAKLDAIAALGVPVCNAPEVVRWNIDKGYLAELGTRGVATIPTLLLDNPGRAEILAAFDHFACDRVVVKRRVGAGAEGQFDFTRDAPPAADWRMGHAALVQPFLSGIVEEGEHSLIFIDGQFCHALIKRPAPGDYRVQSLYGGWDTAVTPAADDLATAQAVIAGLPFPAPLYARIDLVRGPEGHLLLMEAELIEPFLYPLQGPELGPRLLAGLRRLITASVP